MNDHQQLVSTVVDEAERSTINPLKGLLNRKCAYVGFEKYVHTVLKVHELNSAQDNFETILFIQLWYLYVESVVSSTHNEQDDVRLSLFPKLSGQE